MPTQGKRSWLTEDDRAAAHALAASFPAWTTEQLDELARLAAAAPRNTALDRRGPDQSAA